MVPIFLGHPVYKAVW